ncbi:MAG: GlsB/YeaQ/YmgE family stress response membrane protein [Xanthobacteraceae bacterium]|nr:MAG: GlsB/YeaQ/YmgE family stress response membrane protein [Xanthobacteraceae bacterium]
MSIESIVIWLIVGAVAGWLAGMVVKGGGFGLLRNIAIGVIGAVVAGWLLPRIGLRMSGGTMAAIINATIGGIIVLVVLSLLRRA